MVITISEVARGEAGLRLGEAGGPLLECEQRTRPAQHQYSSLMLLHGTRAGWDRRVRYDIQDYPYPCTGFNYYSI